MPVKSSAWLFYLSATLRDIQRKNIQNGQRAKCDLDYTFGGAVRESVQKPVHVLPFPYFARVRGRWQFGRAEWRGGGGGRIGVGRSRIFGLRKMQRGKSQFFRLSPLLAASALGGREAVDNLGKSAVDNLWICSGLSCKKVGVFGLSPYSEAAAKKEKNAGRDESIGWKSGKVTYGKK